MVSQSWFKNLLTLKRSESNASEVRIGVLAFEASGLMTKLLQLWHSLADRHVSRLREDITNSVGIRKLVSENEDYIARLMCAEMTENLVRIAKDVSRLSKKCNSPVLRSFEMVFNDLMKTGVDPFGWQLPWKKMEKKVQKMQEYIVINSNLYQEMEILGEIDQAYRRIKSIESADVINLVEYERKLMWKQQVVKHLKGKSLWNQTYDYTVLVLARSVFSIYGRIGEVFGGNHVAVMRFANGIVAGAQNNRQSHSTFLTQSSVYPFENSDPRNSPTPAGWPISSSGPLSGKINGVHFHSGPFRNIEPTTSNPPQRSSGFSFYSGPLKKQSVKSSSISRSSKGRFQLWPIRDRSKDLQAPLGSAMSSPTLTVLSNGSYPISTSYVNHSDRHPQAIDGTYGANFTAGFRTGSSYVGSSVATSKSKILNPPSETLGAAALAFHFANLIIFIEKLVASPHLVGHEARKDLYNMLPARIRIALRSKLKPYAKGLTATVCDTALAGEWNEAIQKILEWLSPLAHSMIKWQSERSFEHQSSSSRTNVLLVQTLYFANQEKTEAIITELLVGLNYIWRFGREIAAISLAGYASRRTVGEYLDDD